jgi:hypothetical protein
MNGELQITADLHEGISPDTHSIKRRVDSRDLGRFREQQNMSVSQKPNPIIPSVASHCTDICRPYILEKYRVM